MRLASAEQRAHARLQAQHRAARRRAVLGAIVLTGLGTAMALYALPTFILLYGGMIPTVVAFLVDERPGRHLFWTVGAINLAGIVPYLEATWHDSTLARAGLNPIAEVDTWLVIYGASAAGWGLALGLPVIANVALEALIRARLRRLEEARERLAVEWELKGEKSGGDHWFS